NRCRERSRSAPAIGIRGPPMGRSTDSDEWPSQSVEEGGVADQRIDDHRDHISPAAGVEGRHPASSDYSGEATGNRGVGAIIEAIDIAKRASWDREIAD